MLRTHYLKYDAKLLVINFEEQNVTFIVSVTSPTSFNIRGLELFEIRLLLNEKQKVAIRLPVIAVDPPTKYVAFRIDPSAGTYTIIDRFE